MEDILQDMDDITNLVKQLEIKRNKLRQNLLESRQLFILQHPIIHVLYIITERKTRPNNRDLITSPKLYGFFTDEKIMNDVINNTQLKSGQSFFSNQRESNHISLLDFININRGLPNYIHKSDVIRSCLLNSDESYLYTETY